MTAEIAADICAQDALILGAPHVACVGPWQVMIVRTMDGVFAVEDLCSHANQALSAGKIAGGVVTCPLHGAQFEIATGKHLCPPAWRGLRTFPVRIEAGRVVVTAPAEKPKPAPTGGMMRTR